ncbi:DGQHR domain-containing protein [Spirosoma validum]|uniref:DGQHR domain-containing protein n=1 Tax=Spirosoma validum TaxID=2771355 RepID=A0A927GDB3_9BACT|nr:DGQHR domain-containing protein [Spirosoma validum]MBD2753534.1 DGQHR domain-containing protein [Spirosoma validum]
MKTSNPKKRKSPKKTIKKTTKEIIQARRQRSLNNKVNKIFQNMGFQYLHTDGIHETFGGQKGELDNVFLYENIILMVEQTVSDDNDHLKKKDYFFRKIISDFPNFIIWLKNRFGKEFNKFDEYSDKQYKFFYIYIPDNVISQEKKENFSKITFIDKNSLEYFSNVSNAIKHTARFELFKFLKLNISDIGNPVSSLPLEKIETAVIMPETASGFPDGVQVLTFIMSAKVLMECAYVLRKDSWDSSIGLYQRLLDKKKLENIRKFLSEHKRTFIDSIIVTLPFDTSFSALNLETKKEDQIDIFSAIGFSNISMTIPYKINTIGIIDGQHRIYSHYEGTDSLEASINTLRKKRHLFVTGLLFDKTKFTEYSKRKLESEIFLQINNEQKTVNRQLLQYIKSLTDPYSSVGIANNVIKYLNQNKPFSGLFSDSALVKGGIKTPTILQFGLQSLVALDESEDNFTLYKFWILSGGDKVTDDGTLSEYVIYCGKKLSDYFCALKDKYKHDWKPRNKNEGILSATTIVAFLRAYKISLESQNGPKDFEFYNNRFKNLDVDFSKYVSSHWNSLALEIVELCFR